MRYRFLSRKQGRQVLTFFILPKLPVQNRLPVGFTANNTLMQEPVYAISLEELVEHGMLPPDWEFVSNCCVDTAESRFEKAWGFVQAIRMQRDELGGDFQRDDASYHSLYHLSENLLVAQAHMRSLGRITGSTYMPNSEFDTFRHATDDVYCNNNCFAKFLTRFNILWLNPVCRVSLAWSHSCPLTTRSFQFFFYACVHRNYSTMLQNLSLHSCLNCTCSIC